MFNLEFFKFIDKAIFTKKFLYHYRKTNVLSITNVYKENLIKQWINLYYLMYKYIEENHLSSEYTIALQNRISINILGIGLNILESNYSKKQKITRLKKILVMDVFRKNLSMLDLRYMGVKWKIFFGCAKFRLYIPMYILLMIIKKVRKI